MALRRRQFVALLLLAFLLMTIGAISVVFSTQQGQEVYASASSASLWYEIYDYDEYMGYVKDVNFAKTWYSLASQNKTSAPASVLNQMWDNTHPQAATHITVEGQSAYAYFGAYPADLTQYASLKTAIENDIANWTYLYAPDGASAVPFNLSQKTSFSAGEYMMIQVYMQSADGVKGANIFLDVAGMGLTDATTVSTTTSPKDNANVIYYYSDSTVFNQGTAVSSSSTMPVVAGTMYPKNTTTIQAGYIAFKISNTAPASVDICCYNKSATSGAGKSYIRTESNSGTETATISETKKTVGVTAGTSGTAQVSATGVTINGSVPTTGTTESVDSANLAVFKGTTQTTSTSAVTVSIVPDYAGTIQSVAYYVGTSCPSTKTGFNTGTAPASTNFTITPATWNTGETVYILVEVQSYNGAATTYYVLESYKDKYDIKQLTALTVSGGAGSSVCTLTSTFSPTTYTYTINVSKDTSVINVTPTVASGYNETIKVDGTSTASGTTKAVSVTTSKSSIIVAVTSQKGNTQNYTLNLNWLSNDVTISALTASVHHSTGTASSSISDFTYTAASHEYALSGSTKVPYGSTYFTFTITANAGSSATIEYSTDGGSTYSSFNPGNVVFATGTGADTKTIYVRITAPDGVTKQAYPIKVTRYGGDTDSSLSAASYKTKQGSAYGSDSSLTLISNAATISNLAYKKSAVQVKVTPTATSVTRIEYSYTVDTVAGTPGSLVRNNYSPDLEFSTSHKNASTIVVTIRVYAQD